MSNASSVYTKAISQLYMTFGLELVQKSNSQSTPEQQVQKSMLGKVLGTCLEVEHSRSVH